MTIHNLTPDANILFASESIVDILGYHPEEVLNKSCFDYFHPDEVPRARSVHSRGVRLDKAAVLHYARIRASDGRWVSCECCFTIVHDVLVASTSIYSGGAKSEGRALTAPRVRRLFSSSPRDPRYHMLEHLSPKFKMPPTEREPRAALVLNRFTRNLSIMFATNAVTTILGLRPDELLNRPFYHCIQQNCLTDAIACLESAKKNESIAYLRFWFRDPRQDDYRAEDMEDANSDNGSQVSDESDVSMEDEMHVDDDGGHYRSKGCCSSIPRQRDSSVRQMPLTPPPTDGAPTPNSYPRAQTFELEAVVSCTSDGLVVVLRKARPPIPDPQLPLVPAFNYEKGLFAAPWTDQPIEPYYPPELLYQFRAPFLPQFMPLQPHVKAAGGPPRDQLMRSIRDVAVFAWAVVGINGNLASYSHGLPGSGAQPLDGLPIWDPAASSTACQGPESYPTGAPSISSGGASIPLVAHRPPAHRYNSAPVLGTVTHEAYAQTAGEFPQVASQGRHVMAHQSLDLGRSDLDHHPRHSLSPQRSTCDCPARQQDIEPTVPWTRAHGCSNAHDASHSPASDDYFNSQYSRRRHF